MLTEALKEVAGIATQLQSSLIRLENFQKLTELQRDLIGIENLTTPGRVGAALWLVLYLGCMSPCFSYVCCLSHRMCQHSRSMFVWSLISVTLSNLSV